MKQRSCSYSPWDPSQSQTQPSNLNLESLLLVPQNSHHSRSRTAEKKGLCMRVYLPVSGGVMVLAITAHDLAKFSRPDRTNRQLQEKAVRGGGGNSTRSASGSVWPAPVPMPLTCCGGHQSDPAGDQQGQDRRGYGHS